MDTKEIKVLLWEKDKYAVGNNIIGLINNYHKNWVEGSSQT